MLIKTLFSILSIFLLVEFNGHLVEASCGSGPLYYCQNLNKTKECNKQNDCLPLWKSADNNAISNPGTFKFECHFCNSLMIDLKNLLQNNVTEKEVVDVVRELCQKLPSPNVQEMCQLMTNLYLKTALDMLAADIDPIVVCRSLHMCPGAAYLPRSFKPILQIHFAQKTGLQTFKPQINSEQECKDCLAFMNDIREKVASNATLNQVKAALEEILCGRVPSSVVDICKQTVDFYAEKMLFILQSQIDVNMMCSVIGFCPAENSLVILQISLRALRNNNNIPNQLKDDQCVICQNVIQAAKNDLLRPDSQNAILNLLKEQFCSQMGVIKYECNQYIEIYLPLLIKVLSQNTDALDVCKSLEFCPSTLTFKPLQIRTPPPPPVRTTPPVLRSSTCTICEMIVKTVEDKLPMERTKETIERYLNEVCDKIRADNKRCHDIVNQYGDLIIDLLLKFASPELICSSIGLCAGSKNKDNNNLKFRPLIGENCVFCQAIVAKSFEYMRSNRTDEEVLKFVSSKCLDLPQSIQQDCLGVVKQYLPLLIKSYFNKMQANEFCKNLNLCEEAIIKSTARPPLGRNPCTYGPSYWCGNLTNAHRCNATSHCMKNVWKLPTAQAKPVSFAVCDVCKQVVQEGYNLLEQNKTEAELEEYFNYFCEKLPQAEQQLCREYVRAYLPLVIEAFEKQLKPEDLCQKIHLCPANATPTPSTRLLGRNRCTWGPSYWCAGLINAHECRAVSHCQARVWRSQRPKTTPACDICKQLVHQAYFYLADNSTEAELEDLLISWCIKLPHADQETCKKYVSAYVPFIIEAFEKQLQAEVVCQKIGLCATPTRKPSLLVGGNPCTWGPSYWCQGLLNAHECSAIPHCQNHVWKGKTPSSPRPRVNENNVNNNNKMNNATECELCVNGVTAAYKFLNSKTTEDQLKEYLFTWCEKLTSNSNQAQCRMMVQAYVPVLIEAFEKGIKPEHFCQIIRICQKASEKPGMLGKSRCTWGPAYWCSGLLNAHECQALPHCKERVWFGERPIKRERKPLGQVYPFVMVPPPHIGHRPLGRGPPFIVD